MSSTVLTESQISVLSKGLKFCPYPGAPDMGLIEKRVLNFINKSARTLSPSCEIDTTEDCHMPINVLRKRHKEQNNWRPSDLPPLANIYLNELSSTLLRCKAEKHSKNHFNLTNEEKKALVELKSNKSIVIKPADKGSGVVIMNTEDYISEADRQLTNQAHYRKLPSDPSINIRGVILSTLKHLVANNFIKESAIKWLLPETTQPARFYMLPKIHKSTSAPPGRPIMSANGHITERLSEFVDLYIKPHVHKVPSYIKDTDHLLAILRNLHLPPTAVFVSFDVSALYTNIPHAEGVQALKSFLSQHTDNFIAECVATLATLVLENNNFTFNGENYIQTSGTAMGTRMAPSYANIFMSAFEEKHMPNSPLQPLVWKRFIDDILCVFTEDSPLIQTMFEWLNSLHPTIKFTMDKGKSISFLDTYLTIREDGSIRIRPYTKPTDRKQYLLPSSCHPQHIFRAIPYSQALRIIRICNNQEDTIRELKNLKGFFLNRQYKRKTVETAIEKALTNHAVSSSTNTQPTTKKQAGPAIILPYNPRNPRLSKLVNTIWTKYKDSLDIPKPFVSYSRPKNIRDIVTKARLHTDTAPKPKLQNQGKATLTKSQWTADTNYVTFRCPKDHRLTTDEYSSIQSAYEAIENNEIQFAQHQTTCGQVNVIPVEAITSINLGCTECEYKLFFKTPTPPSKFLHEMRNVTLTLQRGLFRKEWQTQPRCKYIKCDCCKHMTTKKHLWHDGTQYRLLKFDCNLENVIYFIVCKKCSIYYVGQCTTTLKTRWRNHKSAINTGKKFAVSQHYAQEGHSSDDMTIGILDTCDDPQGLDYKEAFWIHHLQTIELGLNRKNERDTVLTLQTTHAALHYLHSTTCTPYITHTINEKKNAMVI